MFIGIHIKNLNIYYIRILLYVSEIWNKKEILDLSEEVEKEIQPIFKNIEKIEEINSLKVLSAFQECGLSEMHLNSSTGYGIDEIGRNKIEDLCKKYLMLKMH